MLLQLGAAVFCQQPLAEVTAARLRWEELGGSVLVRRYVHVGLLHTRT